MRLVLLLLACLILAGCDDQTPKRPVEKLFEWQQPKKTKLVDTSQGIRLDVTPPKGKPCGKKICDPVTGTKYVHAVDGTSGREVTTYLMESVR